MKRKWIIFTGTIFLVLAGLIASGPIMSNVERPQYKTVKSEGDIEIREYAPMIIAEVSVQGEREQAIGDGFRILADYIFGNNSVDKSISMTAPVQQQSSEKIAMTTPVQQQESQEGWRVSFVMPSKYTLQTLPRPNDDRVLLKEVPAKQFVVIEFSGKNTTANIEKHEKQLLDYIEQNNISIKNTPKYAFYNPPWTLPFLRRNEIMLEIDR